MGSLRDRPVRPSVDRVARLAVDEGMGVHGLVGRADSARLVDDPRLCRLAVLEERHERRVLDAGRAAGRHAPSDPPGLMDRIRSVTPRQVAVAMLGITAAALPAYNVRFRILFLPTTLLDVLVGLTVAAYLWTRWPDRHRPAARTPHDSPIALLLIAGIGGIVFAPDHTRALGIYRAYFIETIALFYVAVDLVRTPQELRRVVLIAGAGSLLFGIGQVATFAIALAHHAVHIDAGPAFLNTSSNQVPLYLEPPLAFAIGFTLFSKSPRDRIVAAALAAVLLAAVVLTLSRAGYRAVAVLAGR